MDDSDVAEFAPAVTIAKPILIVAGLLAALALLPQRDSAKQVAGLPCALVTEREASQALHSDVQLEPTDGHLCRFVSSEFGDDVALVIVARQDADAPAPARTGASPEQLVVANGRHNALILLEDDKEAPALRAQAERALAQLVAMRLGGPAPFRDRGYLSH